MGKRARGKGVTGRVVRAAASALQERDEDAHAIAQRVYNAARQLERETDADDRPLPLFVLAPLVIAAEAVAPGVAALQSRDPKDEQLALDVAAYLVHGFRQLVWGFDFAHFDAWRDARDAANVTGEGPRR